MIVEEILKLDYKKSVNLIAIQDMFYQATIVITILYQQKKSNLYLNHFIVPNSLLFVLVLIIILVMVDMYVEIVQQSLQKNNNMR
jgi:hypothetical protein